MSDLAAGRQSPEAPREAGATAHAEASGAMGCKDFTRYGADLSGELYGDEDQDGQGGEKHVSEGGWNLQVMLR